MSKLIIKGHNGARFELSVTQFRSPMTASINSVQTRRMAHHFPIRAGQPDVQFTVQFPSIEAHHKFRDFVRDHQLNTLSDQYGSSYLTDSAITLNWQERDIIDWTGYIVTMPGREARFEYSPRVTFGVALMDSFLSKRTFNMSIGGGFWSILGEAIGRYIPDREDYEKAFFRLPQPPTSQQSPQQPGGTPSGESPDNVTENDYPTGSVPGVTQP